MSKLLIKEFGENRKYGARMVNKKNDRKPLVSIIIPIYNGSNYMKEAIDSALNQTYKNIEIIVINDGSNDNGATERIALSYGKKIRYYSKENGGVATALNLGIKKMNGEYFSWLSHDDVYYPNKIHSQINYLERNNLINKKIILYTNCDVIDENGKYISHTEYEVFNPNDKPEYALLHGLLAGITMLIPKTAFVDHGNFDESFRCVQDYLLFFEMLKSYKYIFTPDRYCASRQHKNQVTNTNQKMIEENNFLWTKMQKELPTETKIKLAGSEYEFYKDMYIYLTKYFNYTEAENYAKKQMRLHKYKYIKARLYRKCSLIWKK